jgi:hypothetical protein
MEDVYVQRFGKATFQQMEETYYEMSDGDDDSSADDADEDNITADSAGDQCPLSDAHRAPSAATVTDLQTELEDLKIGNDEEDDWDTIYDGD